MSVNEERRAEWKTNVPIPLVVISAHAQKVTEQVLIEEHASIEVRIIK